MRCLMSALLGLCISLCPLITYAGGGGTPAVASMDFLALQGVDHPTALSDAELSQIEGTAGAVVFNDPTTGFMEILTPSFQEILKFAPGDFIILGNGAFNDKYPAGPFHFIITPTGQFLSVGP